MGPLQRIIDVENVAIFGLDPQRFPTSCVQAYERICAVAGVGPADDVKEEIRNTAVTVFSADPALMPGAHETLAYLKRHGAKLALLTKGDLVVQQRRIAHRGNESADSKRAIELAKGAITASRLPYFSSTFDPRRGASMQTEWQTEYVSNEERIRRQLETTKGSIAIKGWTTRKIDRQIWLAIYEVSIDGDPTLYIFEVNLEGGLVRNVAEDPALKQRYGYADYQ